MINTAADMILYKLAKGNLTSHELRTSLPNFNHNTLRRAASELANAGLIVKVSTGRINPEWALAKSATSSGIFTKKNPRPGFEKPSLPSTRPPGDTPFTF